MLSRSKFSYFFYSLYHFSQVFHSIRREGHIVASPPFGRESFCGDIVSVSTHDYSFMREVWFIYLFLSHLYRLLQ